MSSHEGGHLYRILTERKPNVRRILDRYFDAYTLYPAVGSWKGKREQSLVAEIDCNRCAGRIRNAARDIKRLNKQDAVLIQRVQTVSEVL